MTDWDSSSSPTLDLVIPGAQKAGTSSLIDLLGYHPSITRHNTPEYSPLMSKGSDLEGAVRADFGPAQHGQLLLAKSAGVLHSPWAIDRILQHNPHVRFVAILRDPARRAYSAYLHALRTGHEQYEDFRSAWDRQCDVSRAAHERSFFIEYRRRSEYLTPLRLIREQADRNCLYVTTLEELTSNQTRTLDGIVSWLGICPFDDKLPEQRSNVAATSRIPTIARLMRRESAVKSMARKAVPTKLRRVSFKAVDRLNRQERVLNSMAREDYELISDEFSEHNKQLRVEFGVDTSHWTFD